MIEVNAGQTMEWQKLDEFGADNTGYEVWFGSDASHVGHKLELLERVYDNTVEYTVWVRCFDCGTDFIEEQTELRRVE